MPLQPTDEIPRRQPVWLLLSGLYLDTELSDADLSHIADGLRASGFLLAEVEAIHTYEVCPRLCGNLLTVAGEWVAFDEAELYAGCARLYKHRNSFWYRLSARICHYLVGRDVWKPLGRRLQTG